MNTVFRIARHSTRTVSFSTVAASRNVVVVSGVRLPFALSSTLYEDELAVDLQRLAIQGLLTETALPKEEIDYVVCGNVIQEVRTSNIAREAAINAGLPNTIGAHTVAQVSQHAMLCGNALWQCFVARVQSLNVLTGLHLC